MKKFLLAVSMVVSLALTGCAGEVNATGAAGSVNGTASAGLESVVSTGNLTIATVHGGEFLTAAVNGFMANNEGVNVEVVTYTAGDIEQYSQAINTAVMSGAGEDIIDAVNLSWKKLADKEKLADLNEYLTFAPGEYFQNVIDAFLYNGKRYVVPLAFTFEAFRFNEAYRDKEPAADLTFETVLALAEKYPDVKLFNSANGLDLANLVLNVDNRRYIDIANKTVDINNEHFISVLSSVKALEDRMLVSEEGEDYLVEQFNIYSPAMCHNGTLDYTDMFVFTNGEGQGAFDMYGGFMPSVNANSKQQQLAADFVSYLLTEETQSSPELLFSPVNIKAAAAAAADTFAAVDAEGYAPEGFDLKQNIKIFNTLASRLTVVYEEDRFVRNFIQDELERFYDETQTAEQTAANLQSRLTLYLNE